MLPDDLGVPLLAPTIGALDALGRAALFEVDWSSHPPSWAQLWSATWVPLQGVYVVDTTFECVHTGDWLTRSLGRCASLAAARALVVASLRGQTQPVDALTGRRPTWGWSYPGLFDEATVAGIAAALAA